MVTKIASVIVLMGVYVTAIGGLFLGSLTIFCLGMVAWLMDITNLFTYIPRRKAEKKTKKPKISAKKHSKKSKKYSGSKADKALNGQKVHYDMGLDIVEKPKKTNSFLDKLKKKDVNDEIIQYLNRIEEKQDKIIALLSKSS